MAKREVETNRADTIRYYLVDRVLLPALNRGINRGRIAEMGGKAGDYLRYETTDDVEGIRTFHIQLTVMEVIDE